MALGRPLFFRENLEERLRCLNAGSNPSASADMEDHDIDEDTAEKVQELIDEGLDEDDAVELADIL